MPQVGIFGNCQECYGVAPTFSGLTLLESARNLKTWWDLDDFVWGTAALYSQSRWSPYQAGAGAATSDTVGTSLRPGIQLFSTGTTNVGYCGLYLGRSSLGPFLFGAGVYTFETEIYIPTLSAVAEEYIIRVGFGDTTNGADYVDGAYFIYDRLTNVNWLLGTAANSARTQTDSLVAVAAAAWIKLKIVVNAAATLVSYYINGTLVGTNTLTIPSGAGRTTSGDFTIVKSAGVTARTFQADWAWVHIDLSTTR